MRTSRLRSLLIASLVLLVEANAQLGTFDAFPLAPRLHFVYGYESRRTLYELSYLVSMSFDSGRVELTVEDSTHLGDTLVAWRIKQHEDLWHFRSGYAGDSSFTLVRDSIVTLTERLVGNHELQCASLIWRFPLTSPSQAVFRFVDALPSSFVRRYQPPGPPDGSGSDSLYFDAQSGLRARYTQEETHAISHSYLTLKIEQIGTPTSVYGEIRPENPGNLCRNYPNPFNSSTTISYSLRSGASLRLHVFDLLGKQVYEVDLGHQDPGERKYAFHAWLLPTGAYFYRLRGDNVDVGGRFILSK